MFLLQALFLEHLRLKGIKLLYQLCQFRYVFLFVIPYVLKHLPRGIVFQDHRLLMDRSVADNVALPLVIAGIPREERGKRVRAALEKVGLTGRGKDAPSGLSTGEQQRVGIARAIVGRPALIIADEPTGNLDPQLSEEIMQLFVALRQTGITILIASHDLSLLKRMKQRVVVLDHGHLIDDVPASEVA